MSVDLFTEDPAELFTGSLGDDRGEVLGKLDETTFSVRRCTCGQDLLEPSRVYYENLKLSEIDPNLFLNEIPFFQRKGFFFGRIIKQTDLETAKTETGILQDLIERPEDLKKAEQDLIDKYQIRFDHPSAISQYAISSTGLIKTCCRGNVMTPIKAPPIYSQKTRIYNNVSNKTSQTVKKTKTEEKPKRKPKPRRALERAQRN